MMEDLAGALTNLQRLKFKLGAVEDFSILGIPLSGKTNMADFSVMDGLRLLEGFRTRQLPAEFILNVLAVNPNDGTGGSPRTVSTLTSLESRLLIDGTPTVTGNIERPVEIPGTGQDTTIPIRLTIDLYEFFGNRGTKRSLDWPWTSEAPEKARAGSHWMHGRGFPPPTAISPTRTGS
jgi:hypothetical protein